MKSRIFILCILMIAWSGAVSLGSTLDDIGVTALRAKDRALTGQGVLVAQVEAPLNDQGTPQFEVSPAAAGLPASRFAYRSALGSSFFFPNGDGAESSHADQVAQNFYGPAAGVAPGVRQVRNYEAGYFLASVIGQSAPVRAAVINQSFILNGSDPAADARYDDYIAKYRSVIVSGAGNFGTIASPADCYNGLGVADIGGGSANGPTADGRSKPDITAPAGATSFSTPLVAGAAAVLIQAGRRMGVDAAAAVDPRTVKALLLTGAVKPFDWSHTATAPLDTRYGAGEVNVFNSDAEMVSGRHGPVSRELVASGHPPLGRGPVSKAALGWDYRSVSCTAALAGVNHYRIATTGTGAIIATLVWEKGLGATGINQLQLFLYDGSGSLLASSVSTVDNTQHIYATGLPAGTYELEVVKVAGAAGAFGVETAREIYALAWHSAR